MSGAGFWFCFALFSFLLYFGFTSTSGTITDWFVYKVFIKSQILDQSFYMYTVTLSSLSFPSLTVVVQFAQGERKSE